MIANVRAQFNSTLPIFIETMLREGPGPPLLHWESHILNQKATPVWCLLGLSVALFGAMFWSLGTGRVKDSSVLTPHH